MKSVNDPLDDPRWLKFRAEFEARGYGLKGLWHASDNIIIWAVYKTREGVPDPKHHTIVTRHYGEGNGFGVWLESRTNDIAGGVEEIIGKPSIATDLTREQIERLLFGHGGSISASWMHELTPHHAPKPIGATVTYTPEIGARRTKTYDLAAIVTGLTLMAQKEPRAWAQFMTENDDDATFDYAWQFIIFGKEVYS